MLNITFERFNDFADKSKKIEKYLQNNYNADEETAYTVKLAVFELAGNIIKHSKAKAHMLMHCEGNVIKIMFKGGNDFDINGICLPEQTSEYGRGIFIVKNICESLEYTDGGKQVCVCIKCRQKEI